MTMARQFRGANMEAAALQNRLTGIKRLLLVGGIATGAGLGIFAVLEKTMKPGSDYLRAINRLQMAGLSQVEVAHAVAAAWKNTGDVITTTATQNLASMQDLRNILGSMRDAQWALPIVSKIGTAMASSQEGSVRNNAQDIAFSMAKALDIIGAARSPGEFESQASQMSKVITAFQNRVTPQAFQSVFQYARQAKFDLSDEFKYQFLPTLMLEMSSAKGGGGGSRGVGPMLAAIYRVTNQGIISKKAIPVLERLGLLADHNFAKTSTSGTIGANIRGHELAAQNPFLWNQQVLIPAIMKMLGPNASAQQVRGVINQAFGGNQLAAAAMVEFYSKPQNFLRDQAIIRGAMPYGQAYNQAVKNDPEQVMAALKAQWTNFIITVGVQVTKDAMVIGKALIPPLHDLAMWAERNPKAIMNWVHGFEMLGGALTFAGGVTIFVGVAHALKLVFDIFGVGGRALALITAAPMVASGLSSIGLALGAISVAPIVVVAGGLVALAAAFWLLPRALDAVAHAIAPWAGDAGHPANGGHGGRGAPGVQGSPYVNPYSPHNLHHKTGDVYLDGRKVGAVLNKHFAHALSGSAQHGSSGGDPSAAMPLPGAGYAS